MKICPYCKQIIENDYPYCPNCNKPLISNLGEIENRIKRYRFGDPEFLSPVMEEDYDSYEATIIKDEILEQEIQKIDELLERKEIIGDPIPGSLLLEKSSLYYKKRDLSNAIKNLELALRNFEEDKDIFNVAVCHNEIGLIQEDIGFFDQAIYHFNRSLEILKQLNENHKLVKVLNNLGNIYYLIKDLEQSYKYYQEALDLSKREELIYEEIKTSSNIVEVLYLLEDYERIKRILARNSEFFKQNEDAYGMIQVHIKYGKLYYLIGDDYNQANERLNWALNLIERVSKTLSVYMRAKLEWECFFYLGKLYLLRDNIVDAENYFLRSLEAVRIFEIGDNINQGDILENLAELYNIKGEYDKTIEYYILSCEIYNKFGDNLKCAEIKFKIGKVYLGFEEDKSNSIRYFEEALDLYEDQQYIKEAAEILHKLGDIYINNRMPEVAKVSFNKAREYYRELHDSENFNLIDEKIRSLNNI
ncbi:MAG: tetratricopeptide repeat protein [Candidatus Thorarchaeota archaeon]